MRFCALFVILAFAIGCKTTSTSQLETQRSASDSNCRKIPFIAMQGETSLGLTAEQSDREQDMINCEKLYGEMAGDPMLRTSLISMLFDKDYGKAAAMILIGFFSGETNMVAVAAASEASFEERGPMTEVMANRLVQAARNHQHASLPIYEANLVLNHLKTPIAEEAAKAKMRQRLDLSREVLHEYFGDQHPLFPAEAQDLATPLLGFNFWMSKVTDDRSQVYLDMERHLRAIGELTHPVRLYEELFLAIGELKTEERDPPRARDLEEIVGPITQRLEREVLRFNQENNIPSR